MQNESCLTAWGPIQPTGEKALASAPSVQGLLRPTLGDSKYSEGGGLQGWAARGMVHAAALFATSLGWAEKQA